MLTRVRPPVGAVVMVAQWCRRDGAVHDMRGVAIFEVDGAAAGERVRACRFYLEQVEDESGSVDDDIRRRVGAGS